MKTFEFKIHERKEFAVGKSADEVKKRLAKAGVKFSFLQETEMIKPAIDLYQRADKAKVYGYFDKKRKIDSAYLSSKYKKKLSM